MTKEHTQQNVVSGLGRNHLSLHSSSTNTLQLSNPLVHATVPLIISIYPLDSYYLHPYFTSPQKKAYRG